jgi:type VI secretion system secreted protein VgrG
MSVLRLDALAASAAGMVDNTGIKATGRPGDAVSCQGKLPHPCDPIIAIAAKDGFGVNAGQSLQLVNGENMLLASREDSQFAMGGQMRLHAGQAIGMLGGAVKTEGGGTGMQLVSTKDTVHVQAQADELKIQARDEIDVISANAHIDWAAAKRISLSTASGANITIECGNIIVQCPGKIIVYAGKKSVLPPEKIRYSMPALPRAEFKVKKKFPFSS